nr:hypothetical protein [Hyalangium minutum]
MADAVGVEGHLRHFDDSNAMACSIIGEKARAHFQIGSLVSNRPIRKIDKPRADHFAIPVGHAVEVGGDKPNMVSSQS